MNKRRAISASFQSPVKRNPRALELGAEAAAKIRNKAEQVFI